MHKIDNMEISKKTYKVPELTVVTVKTERGYSASSVIDNTINVAQQAENIDALITSMAEAGVSEELRPNASDYTGAGFDNSGYCFGEAAEGGYFGGGWN